MIISFCNTIDVDECAAGGSHDCDNTGFSVCTNSDGSYSCSCHSGNFTGSGKTSDPCTGRHVFTDPEVSVLQQ